MKALFWMLGIAAALFGALDYNQFHALKAAQQQVATLKAQLTDKAEKKKIECAKRAEEYFQVLRSEVRASNAGDITDYTNHYNLALNRCLIATIQKDFSDGHLVQIKTLMDVDEKRTFGEAWESNDQLSVCNFTPPDKPEIYCKTTDEYDGLVATLMR